MNIERFIVKKEKSRIIDKKLSLYDRQTERNIVEVVMDTQDEIVDEIINMAKEFIENYYEVKQEYNERNEGKVWPNCESWNKCYEENKDRIYKRKNENKKLLKKLSAMADEIINSAYGISHTIEEEL